MSAEFAELERELQALATRVGAFNAYVFDASENLCCAARGYSAMRREDLLDFLRAALSSTDAAFDSGVRLDACLSGKMGHAYLKSFASNYVLLLRFADSFDRASTRELVATALPRLEKLTSSLPPSGGPGSHPHEAARRDA